MKVLLIVDLKSSTWRLPLKIYIAGASAELDRASRAMAEARAAGFEVTKDWVADTIKERVEGGRQNHEMSHSERLNYATSNLSALQSVDVFWILVPEEGAYTTGAWVELGAALQYSVVREALKLPALLIIVSGPEATKHIFTSMADEIFDTDSEAMNWLFAQGR